MTVLRKMAKIAVIDSLCMSAAILSGNGKLMTW
jgi:hypothetical protein